MKKAEAKALAEKYGMEIMRNPVTREAWGCAVDSPDLIPELDELADDWMPEHLNSPAWVERVRLEGYGYRYVLHVPVTWFDLWGWV